MDIVNKVLRCFEKPQSETQNRAADGLCPVCWGYQEYDQQVRTLFRDKQISIKNCQESYMLVQDFVKNYIDGIQLRDAKTESCPKCGHTKVEHKIHQG